ncbi:MAG TPA: DUF4965 domain-containing protein [Clostridiaceae bacterium]|nr:DUF4965 domain-containing protein [Clostridiaceae bacterium]
MKTGLRPPAVPLVTVDPYFSVWSCADNLYDDYTRHWTGKPHSLTGLAMIDGTAWRFAGLTQLNMSIHPFYFARKEIQGMEQKSLSVKPLSTTYAFEGGGVRLEVDFTNPLLMDDLDIMSRPVTYVTFAASSVDGKPHDLKLYLDVTGEWCVSDPNQPEQRVVWERKQINDSTLSLVMGVNRANILARCGDDLCIDWGYLHLVLPGENKQGYINSCKIRTEFAQKGCINTCDDNRKPRDVYDDTPVLACTIDLDVRENAVSKDFIILAYDDIYSIEYFNKPLCAYWRRNGQSFESMLENAIREYEDIKEKCNIFGNNLIKEAISAGGEKYADIISLAYRQAIAAHKLVADTNGEVLFISKECFSNGCAATVDVSYPSIPLFLLYNPELVKGMLRPIFKFANSGDWPYEFAPHDAGKYPKVNGQVYRVKMGWAEKDTESGKTFTYGIIKEDEPEGQMPVEECGNMLIIAAALAITEKDAGFARDNWDLLSQWANYLLKHGFDPGMQLCTDDFAGHLAHNANLSVKTIMGLASYSILCDMLGKTDTAAQYLQEAKNMVPKWEEKAREDDHYKLTFTDANTWSLKYNMIWDDLFGLDLFPQEVKNREVAYYLKKKNRYGTPCFFLEASQGLLVTYSQRMFCCQELLSLEKMK